MLESVSFENFKALRAVRVDGLGRLTVLVGPNGSGKTSVLAGVHCASRLGTQGFEQVLQGSYAPQHLLRRGETSFRVELAGRWGDEPGSLGFDPCTRAHRLTASHDQDLRSAKRVLGELSGQDPARVAQCLEADLERLAERGVDSGLAAFLTELSDILVPVFLP